jgi:CheY-like chemotaxis protein
MTTAISRWRRRYLSNRDDSDDADRYLSFIGAAEGAGWTILAFRWHVRDCLCWNSDLARGWLIPVSMMGVLRTFGAVFLGGKHSGNGDRAEKEGGPQVIEQNRGIVLAIDDDPDLLGVLRQALADGGFTVLTTTSGAKGLDMLRYCQRDVQVVVLDYNMPRLNGSDTLSYLKKLNPKVKVLALTGIELGLLPESFRTGVDKVLPKPCSNTQLMTSINELLGAGASPSPAAA